jgi:hypothetical protein
VLVDNIKPMELPDYVTLASLVWFDEVDVFDHVWPDALYISSRFGFILPTTVVDRKAQSPQVSIGTRSAGASTIKPERHMIQSASEIMERIASDNVERGGNGIHSVRIIEQLAGLRIALTNDAIWVSGEELSQFGVEIKDVMFGPV